MYHSNNQPAVMVICNKHDQYRLLIQYGVMHAISSSVKAAHNRIITLS